MSKIRRVFISHTSEFTKYPEKKSFIDAAIAAVNRAGCVPFDMGYFTARDEKPAQYCIEWVRECEVYVGVIGFRYGSPVRDRSDLSYTELEFEAASQAPPKTRLVFLLDPASTVPVDQFSDAEYGRRQKEFRKRLSDAGVTCKPFSDVHELEKLIYQALIEGVAGSEHSSRQERIEWPEGTSPYPGLLSFDQEYADLFFGRDQETNEVIAKMSEPDGRFLIISGASGSGKSSLVAAGVWRALKEERLPGSAKWGWLRIQPGDGKKPFDSLAWGLKQKFPISTRPDDLAGELVGNKKAIADLLAAHLTHEQELVLFIDQLEELFTRGFKDEDIRNYLEYLIANARDTKSRLRVVATVRSEFIARLEESTSVLQVLNTGYNYHLGPVLPRTLQDMIENPAQATGYDFEPELVEDILRDAGQEPGSLPLVAYALKQLFERRRGRTFTRDAYQVIGGVAGAIGTQANQVMDGLDAEARGAFDTVFAELVHIERDRPPTRKRVTQAAFTADKSATRLIEALAGPNCRVLVIGGGSLDASAEVAHEKLFTAWPRLREWIDQSGESLRLIDYAEEAARRWHEMGGHLDELWQSRRANDIQVALSRFSKNPSPLLEHMLRPQQMLIAQLNQDGLSHEDRLLIGKKLAEFGDPRPGVGLRPNGLPDIIWAEIPQGRIKLDGIEHVFEVKPFLISKYPVTNMQFEAFLTAEDGYQNPKWWEGIKRSEETSLPSWQESNAPREKVSWFEAVAFCRWLSQQMESNIRLPTEWEWQQAATGGDSKRSYPWPDEWDAARCNSRESRLNRTTAVGIYPSGATRQGVMDMAGNVWEWCLNRDGQSQILEELRIDDTNAKRVIRGGAWNRNQVHLSSLNRFGDHAGDRSNSIGFRLAQDIP